MFSSFLALLLLILFVYNLYVKSSGAKRSTVKSSSDINDDNEPKTEFERAVAFIRSGKCSLSDAAKLAVYGIYKQATVGDVNTDCPSFDFVGAAKWKSWKSYEGLSKEEAEEKYIDYVTKLVPQWKESSESDAVPQESKSDSSGSGFGFKVSKIAVEEEDEVVTDDIFMKIANGETDYVVNYIKEHPDHVNDVDSGGQTMLHWACDRGDMRIVLELLNHNASVSVRDNYQLTPLDNACINENNDIVAVLLDSNAKLSDCMPESIEMLPQVIKDKYL